jgi:stage V sporulation protein D (sporulation-specific penicillin-binding protein)
MSDTLPYLGYEASYSEEELKKLNISVPEVSGMAVSEAQSKIINSKLQYQVVGSGDKVIRQLPESGNQVLSGGVVILYTDDTGEKSVTVPNLVGLTATEANRVAASSGINIEFSGNITTSGLKAYSQSIEKGKEVDAGTVVTVYFRDESTVDG